MIIDFHTHVFPDKIAASTIAHLSRTGNIKAHTDGTLAGLKSSMNEAGIDLSIVLPVVTKPKQFESVNQYAAEITGHDGIISCDGIHPDTDNYKKELDYIKSLGLKGIKLHPDYQRVRIDDEKYLKLITYATDLDLIVVIHAGFDGAFQQPYMCTPKHSSVMLDYVLSHTTNPEPKIILAHFGGLFYWDKVEELLVGKNVYFDLGYTLGKISDEQLYRIIQNHGIDRILFATDSPWGNQKEDLSYFTSLNLTQGQKERILYQNALSLLKTI